MSNNPRTYRLVKTATDEIMATLTGDEHTTVKSAQAILSFAKHFIIGHNGAPWVELDANDNTD